MKLLRLRRQEPTTEPPADADERIVADLSGAVISGQVAIGEHIVQIHAEHGAIVNYTAPQERPVPRLRPLPVHRLPRDFPALLGRQEQIALASVALESGSPVELSGEPGVGKTALLRHLAHREKDVGPCGAIFISGGRQPVDDLLQLLFESFYECAAVLVPTDAQLAEYLQSRRALIVLDDLELERDELERLSNAVPASVFLTAAVTRRLWGEGRAIALAGLDEDAALALVEGELGRSLTSEERGAAQAYGRAVKGHPLRMLQAAALMREGAAPASPPDVAQALSLDERELRVMAPLAALPGVALHGDDVAEITAVSEAGATLKALAERALVQAHSPRYTLALSEDEIGQEAGEWRERTLAHFATWVQREPAEPTRVLENLDAILALLEWGSQAARWPEVLRLARGVDAALALSGRWGAWGTTLGHALRAAGGVGDRTSEAWALHQLGSRALCLDSASEAAASLGAALELRESLGDEQGAAVTRHNLDVLGRPPPTWPPPGPRRPPLAPLLAIAVAILAAFAVVFLLTRNGPEQAAPPPATRPQASPAGSTTRTTQPTTTTDKTPPSQTPTVEPRPPPTTTVEPPPPPTTTDETPPPPTTTDKTPPPPTTIESTPGSICRTPPC